MARAQSRKPPEEPKKEMGAGFDIAQIVLPLIASTVGTPLMGMALSALMEGAESKLEGGSWKEAIARGGISGATSAITGGAAGAAGDVATDVATDAVVDAATDQAVKEVVGTGAEQVVGAAVSEGADEIGKEAIKEIAKDSVTGGATSGPMGLDVGIEQLATPDIIESAPIDSMFSTEPAGGVGAVDQFAKPGVVDGTDAASGTAIGGETEAKKKFIEQMTELGTEGYGAYQEAEAEKMQNRRAVEKIGLNEMMKRRQNSMMSPRFSRTASKSYTPYGG